MKTPLFILLILIYSKTFQLTGTAQDIPVQSQVDKLVMALQASPDDPDRKFDAAWQLSVIGPAARSAIPALVNILVSANEHPKARMSALNAVGHIGISDKSVDPIIQTLRDNPQVFRGSGSDAVVNGSFELVSAQNDEPREKGAFGETMFPPGSLDLVGWTTYAGILMIQDESARPGGKNSLELGPRDVPGCVSQTILTTAGRMYELKFFTCTGRGFAHFNRQLGLRVADVDKTVDCVVGAASEMIKVPFKATSTLTTVTFYGVGNAGFGPMIDEVTIEPADGARPEGLANETSRIQQLDAIAQRLRGEVRPPSSGNDSPPPARVNSTETQADGIALISEEGQPFVGHQLEFFDTSEPGVLSTKKPAWISLYRTEGRAFTLAGEVSLGGAYDKMLFAGDLPDGFALFLREWDGVQRYQLDSCNIKVKRRLLHGQPTSDIIPIVEFAPSHRDGWTPFSVRVSKGMIEYSFAGNVARLPGPLDTDGANKIAIAPGTRLRNLRLSVQDQPNPPQRAQVMPQPFRFRLDPESDKRPVAVPPRGLGQRFGPGRLVPRFGAGNEPQIIDNGPPGGGPKRGVPDGEYLVNLEWWNQKQNIRLKVRNGGAEVIKSSDPKLDGTTGTFQPLNDGGLYIFFRNEDEGFGGQVWRLQPGGSFEIKEIPDRGEKQRAILAPQNF